MPRSRRTLLKTAGLAFSSGTLASIAGCLGDPSTGSSGSPDEPTSDSPTSSDSTPDESSTPNSSEGTATSDFARWLPDPTKTPLRDGYEILYFDLKAIRSHQDSIHENAYSRLEDQMLRPVPSEYVDKTAVDAALSFDDVRLVLGSFDPEAIGEKLTSDRQSSTTTQSSTTATQTTRTEPEHYKGFDLYDTGYVYAVSENVLMEVSSWQKDNSFEYTKAVIDAPGETGHYGDSNEYVAAMMGVVDENHALWCYPENMDGSMSRGFRKDIITGELKSWRFGTETTHLTFANTYPNAEAAESGELSDHIESESKRFGAYDGLDVETEGRLAWTAGTIPTKEFDHLAAGGPDDGVYTTHQSRRNPF
ncbi:hypothetical protein SAMN05421858_2731 [Haladaptatus litoreus]|uniref:Uncharacterized protein n=1 Tax=Haladaptatus litoreus TaxID=553468 RepID=A0A1N7BST1_9EURY|nr:hypothetical protein [Haladaptatus litoreus]SIR54264.1 hypothetical protein SAMN05421858_2731 [Haladaptatus litoreus]